MALENTTTLLAKYNVAVPRYTSYPTVPYWHDSIDPHQWLHTLALDYGAAPEAGISLYIHLPFCESLCTYCGCNKKITANHSVELPYIRAIHAEWQLYLSVLAGKPVLRALHLGGGTPTFFSPEHLTTLLQPILNSCTIPEEKEFSFEGHPNNTTKAHLATLRQLGFDRVSYGVQDNNPQVQAVINRIQPLENVACAITDARDIGFRSVNFDLVYGLPLQTVDSVETTINQVIALRPDRIAFYSYAHVPWTSRGQRLFDETDLPNAAQKLAMYHAGKQLFLDNGYKDVGMDHFALPTDELYDAQQNGKLHRSFMGYTTQHTSVLIGLGVSSISSTNGAYVQNAKALHNYYAAIEAKESAVHKGILLNNEDKRFARYILDISCKGVVHFEQQDIALIRRLCLPALTVLQQDGLIELTLQKLTVTELGRNFIRNICSAIDLYLIRSKIDSARPVFSNAV
jgi:oxygen-independent coproporphyrinogen III oxidase